MKTFGSVATMVLHLANRIDRPGTKLFFDNYFSTFTVFEVLMHKKIYAAGTVRLDRFAKPPFSSDTEVKKRKRMFRGIGELQWIGGVCKVVRQ